MKEKFGNYLMYALILLVVYVIVNFFYLIWYIADPEGFWGISYFIELLRIAFFVLILMTFVVYIIFILGSSLISIIKNKASKNDFFKLIGITLIVVLLSIFNYIYYAGFSFYLSKSLSDKYSTLKKTERYLEKGDIIGATDYAKSSYEKETEREQVSKYLFLARLYSETDFDKKQKLIAKYSALISYAYCLKVNPKSIEKAESLFNNALKLIKTDLLHKEKNNLAIFPTLSLAEINLDKGKYQIAENYFNILYELNKTPDQEDIEYIINSNLLFVDQALRVGDVSKAMRLQIENLNLYEKTDLSKTSSNYLGFLLLATESELYLQNFENASKLLLQSIPIADKKQNKDIYSLFLLVKAHYCHSSALAKRGNEAILNKSWWERVKGLLSDKQNVNEELLNEAQHCYLQLAQLNKEKLGINSNEYIVSLNQLASFYSSIGNFNLAQKKYQEALFILKHRKEVHKDLYFNVLLNIVNLKFDNSTSNYDLEEIEKHYHQKLIANYLFLAEDEKVAFSLNMEKKFNIINSIYIRQANEKAGINLYNNTLAMKNIALYSNQNIRNYLNVANSSLKTNFEILLKENEKFVYSKTKSKHTEFNLIRKQRKLIEQITADSNFHFIDPTEIKWEDIKKTLNKQQIAIEIINLPINKIGKNDKAYFALLIRNNSSAPEVLPLFLESELKTILNKKGNTKERINSIYQKEKIRLSNLIWKKIENKISPNDKIYLSVSGLLNTISFPALFDEKKLDITYLGSTKEIVALKNKTSKKSKIALFGDINYGKNKNNDNIIQGRNSNFNLLPYSKNEVNGIKSIFEAAATKKVSVFNQNIASEEIFRKLNGCKFDIIHIATHGYYDAYSSILIGADENRNDNVLLKSGLVFSNANHNSTNTINDGILNSFDISQMDLSNVDLVVLSACETGLGSINGSEGVFGLQRAFRMAGAKSLIVSLWQVPDHSTSELMVHFYKFYLNGFSKKEALGKAQSEIKKKYKLPFYWGGFILIE